MTGYERHINLLNKKDSKEITQEELNKECAYWFMDMFDEIRHRPLPSTPMDLAEYEVMTLKERSKVPIEFFQKPSIKMYFDQKSIIESQNLSNKYWLREFKKSIPAEDVVSHEKYQDKINDFENPMTLSQSYGWNK